VIRHTEPGMNMADCAGCALRSACGLAGVLHAATAAFLGVLDSHSLNDAASDKAGLAALIAALPGPPAPVTDERACSASPHPG
jgi:Rrf2 family nitric oxide-sensitive transcriptional repressor